MDMDSSACGHVHQYIIKLRYLYVAAIINAMPSMVPHHTTALVDMDHWN